MNKIDILIMLTILVFIINCTGNCRVDCNCNGVKSTKTTNNVTRSECTQGCQETDNALNQYKNCQCEETFIQ
jgi:hypothetical protein